MDKQNYSFSIQFNFLHKQILDIQKSKKKVALYGWGVIGQFIQSMLKDQIVLIIDKHPKEHFHNNTPIISPDKINEKTFDILLIATLGREKEIVNHLIKFKPTLRNRIISFNLKKEKKEKIISLLIKLSPLLKILYFPIACLLFFLNYRIMSNFRFTGFGHIAVEPSLALSSKRYNKYKHIYIVDNKKVANNYLMNLWKQKTVVISNTYFFHLLWPLFNHKFICINVGLLKDVNLNRYINNTKTPSLKMHESAYFGYLPKSYYDQLKYLNTNSFLKVPNNDILSAQEKLKKTFNIKTETAYITINLRDDLNHDSLRSINKHERFLPSFKYLHDKGIKIIKLGNNPYVSDSISKYIINYPASSLKSEEMDIYLLSTALFHIGNINGPADVSNIFKVPIFMIDLSSWSIMNMRRTDIYLPLIYKNKNGAYLSIKDYLENKLDFIYTKDTNYKDLIENLEFIHSSSNLILEGTKIMVKKHLFKEEYKHNEKLQKKWKGSFPKNSFTFLSEAKVVDSFLEKNKSILFNEEKEYKNQKGHR